MGAQDAIEDLEAKVTALMAELEAERGEHGRTRHRALETERRNNDLHAEFGELKERVAILGVQNAEMRGYIGRVQEDDTVREELVQTGDILGGEVYLAPKRKHRHFDERLYEEKAGMMGGIYANETARRRKHWVNY
jgi:hypothetical protein